MSVLGLTLTLSRSSRSSARSARSSRSPSRERPTTSERRPARPHQPASASATHLRIPGTLDTVPSHTPGYSNSTSALPHFPSDLPDLPLPPPRFPITPREEEGRETLPAYSCSLHIESVLDRKIEMSTPFERSTDRSWGRYYFVLHGTKLDVHTVGRGMGGLVSGGRGGKYGPGRLVESYTLQLAEVGVAADYRKRSWVVRVRAEGKQFLMGFETQELQMQWLEALSAAIDLSPSLEERALPQLRTLPRRRRRIRVAPLTTTTISTGNPDGNGNGTEQTREEETPLSTLLSSLDLPFTRRTTSASSASTTASSRQPAKWSPPPITRTPEDVMRYAKRCMAVLCSDAPRQSDLVIVNGKRYRLVYETREMVPDDGKTVPEITVTEPAGGKEVDMVKPPDGARLPGYEEVVGTVAMERRRSAVV